MINGDKDADSTAMNLVGKAFPTRTISKTKGTKAWRGIKLEIMSNITRYVLEMPNDSHHDPPEIPSGATRSAMQVS